MKYKIYSDIEGLQLYRTIICKCEIALNDPHTIIGLLWFLYHENRFYFEDANTTSSVIIWPAI